MADPSKKLPENVPGPYYRDDACIACEACVEEAPGHFRMRDDDEYAYVFRQPATPEERALCESALSVCPTDAIGNDG